MKLRSTRLALAGVAATAALVAGSAAPAFAADAPISTIPADCYNGLSVLGTDGTLGGVSLNAYGSPGLSTYKPNPGTQPFGFVPEYLSEVGGAGDTVSGYAKTTRVVKDPVNGLRSITTERASHTAPTLITSSTPVAGDVTGVKALKVSYPYAYGLTTTGKGKKAVGSIVRYGYDSSTGLTGRTVVAENAGLASHGTMSVTGYYSESIAHVYTTTSAGALVQTTVPFGTPQSPTVTTVAASGFGGLSALSVRECSTGTGQTLFGTTTRGQVALWYDANRNDRSSADFVRVDTAGLKLAKGERAYIQ